MGELKINHCPNTNKYKNMSSQSKWVKVGTAITMFHSQKGVDEKIQVWQINSPEPISSSGASHVLQSTRLTLLMDTDCSQFSVLIGKMCTINQPSMSVDPKI